MLRKIKYETAADLKKIKDIFAVSVSSDKKISSTVSDIITDVVNRKNAAVFEYTKKFDNFDINGSNIKVSEEEINEALKKADKEFIKTMEFSFKRISEYHERQKPADEKYKDDSGNQLGWKWNAVDSVGLYVPGGKAFYPSSVLMNAVPAMVAGVKRIVMVTPTQGGLLNPILLQAARICGLSEIYKIGGAQAVAALAYGTETIEPVVKIVGPGNAYVAEAKRQVYGKVGIDSIAGPSEILVLADNTANPKYVAADLLSQAEHDELARCILVTDSEELVDKVNKELEVLIERIAKTEIASESIKNNGIAVIVSNLEKEGTVVANIVAPEHIEIMTADPEKFSRRIHNAGAIFLGEYSCEAIGDYVAGPSHVLPTSAAAKFSSGLGVLDFMKRTSMIKCTKDSFEELAPHAMLFAKKENLDAHGLSVKVRL